MVRVAAEAPTRDFDLLKSLEVFISVAETGSMTAAATRLHITQSAISQQIKLIETDFGAPLFYRDTRPLRLTPAGIVLRNRASAMLMDAKKMRTEVRQAAAGRLPHLRMAVLSTFARYIVPVVLDAVRGQKIAVNNVTMTRGLTVNHAQDLANRDIDIALTSDAFDEAPDLEHIEVVRETYLLVTPKGTDGNFSNLQALAGKLPFLGYSNRTQSGQRVEQHFRRLRLDLSRGAFFESPADLITAIASGHGWSVLSPSQLLDPMQAGAKVEARRLPAPTLNRTIGIVWRKGEISDTVQQITALCRTTFEQEHLPRLAVVLPDLPDCFQIAPDPFQAVS